MPELPEVETVARQIRSQFLNKRITEVIAQPAIIFRDITAAQFASELAGKKLDAVRRYGKFLFWQTGNLFPMFHLGMSGIFLRDKKLSMYPQHIHISFEFEDGGNLYFQDARKFSKVYLLRQEPDFDNLGVDPSKENFTLINFRKLLNLKKMNIKTLLMDQKIIAGIGNIYASEILFGCGIRPTRSADSLSSKAAERLFYEIKRVLNAAIQRFGTTYTAYRTVDGSAGTNQNFLKVYQREGEPCIHCGRPIKKIIQNSRSTFYCPKCQR